MPRSLRIEFPGAYYHVMARGNRREEIFFEDRDRALFLDSLGEACGMTGWRVHAWVLMSNHYHLLIETPEANLVAGMQWLQNSFTRRLNTRHGLWGRLFGDRYKAVLVEGSERYYYETLMDYIHLNPVRARLVTLGGEGSVLDYPWSSVAGGYALAPKRRPKWLAVGDGLAAFRLRDDARGRRRFVERLDARARSEGVERAGLSLAEAEEGAEGADGRQRDPRRGWCWGSEQFAKRVLEIGREKIAKVSARDYRGSAERKAHDLASAETLLAEGLRAAGLEGSDLRRLRGSDARKVAIAEVIWSRTTASQKWIAEHLAMGSAANVSQQLRRKRAGEIVEPKPMRTLRKWAQSQLRVRN